MEYRKLKVKSQCKTTVAECLKTFEDTGAQPTLNPLEVRHHRYHGGLRTELQVLKRHRVRLTSICWPRKLQRWPADVNSWYQQMHFAYFVHVVRIIFGQILQRVSFVEGQTAFCESVFASVKVFV